MSKRRLLLACLLVIPVYLLLSLVLGAYFCEGALHPPRRPLSRTDEEVARALASHFSATFELIEISSSDGIGLQAWFFRAEKPTADAVLLLHGIADNRAGMVPYARIFLRHGYSVLLPDLRGHGESGGDLITYGIREAIDVRLWVDWVVEEQNLHCIFGLGESLGAAILLQSLALKPPFCAVVAESSFSSLAELTYDYAGRALGTGPWLGRTLLRPAVAASHLYSRLRYGIDLRAASPEQAVATTGTPILLVHGRRDDNIPLRHSQRLANANPGAISLWEVPSAGHTAALGSEPEEFERQVTKWFAHTSAQPPVGSVPNLR